MKFFKNKIVLMSCFLLKYVYNKKQCPNVYIVYIGIRYSHYLIDVDDKRSTPMPICSSVNRRTLKRLKPIDII